MSDIPETTEPNGLHHLDDVKVGSIVYWGFVSVAVTLLTMMFLHSLYGWYIGGQREVKSYENQGAYEFARAEVARQEGLLHAAPGWANEEKTRVAVPIDRAMALTLEEYNSQGTVGDEENPATSATEQPAAQQPAVEDSPVEESPVDEPPAADEKSADEEAADEKMEEAAPATEEPNEEPATEEPTTEEPSSDEPSSEEPATDEPATDEPSTDEPTTETPGTEEPATEEPAGDEPPAN